MKPGIGFHELRQACEISVLREDLERLVHETGSLRDGVEAAVEQVRARFAALSASELSDATVMADLLQFAVTTLLDIREQARRINMQTGPVADDDRPSWMAAADAPRLRPSPSPAPAGSPPAGAMPAISMQISVPPPPPMPSPMPPAIPPAVAAPRQVLPKEPPAPPPPATSPGPPSGPQASSMPPPAAPSLLSREPPPSLRPPEPVLQPPSASPSASWLTSGDVPLPPSRAAIARATPTAAPQPGGIDWLGPAGR